jgi:hypothetical protein
MSTETIAFATIVAGAIGVPLVNGIKKLFNMTGYKLEAKAALLVTVAVAVILGVVVLALTGAFKQPVTVDMLGGVVAGVFAVATVIYKVLASTPDPSVQDRLKNL